MPRAAFRLASLVAALTVTLTGLAVGASTASAAEQAVHDAINTQLSRKPGGTVIGNSVVYAAEGVTVKYIPNTAQGKRADINSGGSCDQQNLCLYANAYWGTQVLQTSSRWCPKEGSSHLYLSHYGLWGKVQSANSNLPWWSRMYWEDSWGAYGAQWTLAPYDAVAQASSAHNDWVEVCIYQDDLTRSHV